MQVRIKRFDKKLPLPEKEKGAAAYDLHCREDCVVEPNSITLVPVNVAIKVPEGYFLLLAARSSTPLKKGLLLANGIGIVDPFYCGDKDEIKVQLLNHTDKPVKIATGEQLTQAILIKAEAVQWQEVDTFGTDGHGGYWV